MTIILKALSYAHFVALGTGPGTNLRRLKMTIEHEYIGHGDW